MKRKRRRVRKKEEETLVDNANEEEVLEPDGKRTEERVDAEMRIIAKYKDRIKNPITAIRAHCVECFGAAVREVADCPSTDCALWPFRMGKNTMHSKYGKPKAGGK